VIDAVDENETTPLEPLSSPPASAAFGTKTRVKAGSFDNMSSHADTDLKSSPLAMNVTVPIGAAADAADAFDAAPVVAAGTAADVFCAGEGAGAVGFTVRAAGGVIAPSKPVNQVPLGIVFASVSSMCAHDTSVVSTDSTWAFVRWNVSCASRALASELICVCRPLFCVSAVLTSC
jgi:hypothetical protein